MKLYRHRKRQAQKYLYNTWATANEERCFVMTDAHDEPLVSIVVPAFNPAADDFRAMVFSVVNQHYQNWELIIVNASSDKLSRAQLSESELIDTRIRVIEHANQGISSNTNIGIEQANGTFVAFLDHDDVLHPCALHTLLHVARVEKADLIYSDEDKLSAEGSIYYDPFCKPKWSLDLLRNVNYINHLVVAKTEHVRKVQGLRQAFDGAQDYDLLLRIIDDCQPKIVHVPRVLYHWRAAATSTAANFDTKAYVLSAGTKALQEHLDRNNIEGKAEAIPHRPGFYRTKYRLPSAITVILPPIDPAAYRKCAVWLEGLLPCLESYETVQIIVDSSLEQLVPSHKKVSYVFLPAKEYWPSAAKAIRHDVSIGFTVAAQPYNQTSIDQLIGRAYRESVIAAPVLLSDGGNIIDAGLVAGAVGFEGLFRGYFIGESTYFGTTEWVRNVDGLTMGVYAGRSPYIQEILKGMSTAALVGNEQLQRLIGNESDLRIVMDASAHYTLRGDFQEPKLVNDSFFNPEIMQTSTSPIEIRTTDWGSIGDKSERDND